MRRNRIDTPAEIAEGPVDLECQQQFPLMNLPMEIRLLICDFALEDLVGTVTALRPDPDHSFRKDCYNFASNPHTTDVKYYKEARTYGDVGILRSCVLMGHKGAPLLGPLALLHVSSRVRVESVGAMSIAINAHYHAVIGHHTAALKARGAMGLIFGPHLDLKDEADSQVRATWNHRWKIRKVKEALDEAARSINGCGEPLALRQ